MPVLPFTELFEQAKLEVGDRATDTDTENYYKSLVNLVYTNLLPQVREWRPFITVFDDPIQVIGNYNTGTVDITSGSATVTGTSTVWTSAMVGRRFKVTNDDEVYIVETFTSTTSIALNRTYNGSTVDDGNYEILDDLFSMDSDFDRNTDSPRIWYMLNGSTQFLEFVSDVEFINRQTWTPAIPRWARIFPDKDSSDLVQIQITPAPDDNTLFYGEFIKSVSRMTEYVTGTATTTHNSTAVTGASTVWITNVVAGDYFRIDSDGRWSKISTTPASDTALTLSTAYPGVAASSATYTICKAPVIDDRFHAAILYGACALAAANQDDDAGFQRYAKISGIPMTILQAEARKEGRENYGTQRVKTIYQVSRTGRVGNYR